MKARVGGDQAAAGFEAIGKGLSQGTGKVVVQVMKDANQHGDIGLGDRRLAKLLTSSQMNVPRPPCSRRACTM